MVSLLVLILPTSRLPGGPGSVPASLGERLCPASTSYLILSFSALSQKAMTGMTQAEEEETNTHTFPIVGSCSAPFWQAGHLYHLGPGECPVW